MELTRFLLRAGVRPRSAEPAWGCVSIILLDDAGMGGLNEAVMGLAGATDVVACGYDPLPGEVDRRDADLAVNVQRAVLVAGNISRCARGWTADDELALYVAHGCDHLHGADDASDMERRRMRRRELVWLRRARERGLVKGLADWSAMNGRERANR